ncbi:DUF302 domain-containing protein [Stappia sp. MMSF_3263]|uniref:DUF302 domain-containing protein n=1 Tax=Stappia sp. MMSF_3263 TaxID=3046693 RepID=UPI00273EE79C|nr:DUF302 domain-containing protein [Stappia sp. MMSF_3263]
MMQLSWTVGRGLRSGVAALGLAAFGMVPVSFADDMSPAAETRVVEAAFEDVRFDVENAIINRGLVIDYVSHIGEMLARTGEDVGSGEQVFARAEAMLFCSAALSRAAMEADAGNIAFCPYSVFLYETPDAPGKVTVGYRRLPETGTEASRKALAAVNELLSGIVGEAAGE